MAVIKTYNSVPSVYTHHSRDFQLIGHLYEAVFNSSKVATDMVSTMVPGANFDERLINLSSTTRGFTTKHEYSSHDLSMILGSFASLLKIKGTKKAIDSAINILLRAQGISDEYVWLELDPQTKYFNLGLSDRVTDRALLFDLFDYILPFGFTYRVTNYSVSALGDNITGISSRDSAEVHTSDRIEDFQGSAIVSNRRTTATILEETTLSNMMPESVNPKPIVNGEIQEESS